MMRIVARSAGILFAVGTLVALVLLGVLAVQRMHVRPRTDDAYLQADLVHLAPDVSGRIVALHVANNQRVRRGELLFVVDPEPYRLTVARDEASLRSLEAQLSVNANQVSSETSKASEATSGIETAQTQAALADRTVARLEPLLARGYVPRQQVDQARSAQVSAHVGLRQAKQQAAEATQAISSTQPLVEQISAARQTLALAQRDLRLTAVRAPCDGLVTALDTAEGEYALTGKPVFTIIDSEHWWAVGNFRETDLRGLRPGQAALVYVMIAPDVPVRGTVESLGWGVAPDEGSTLDGLPRVPRSLDWVRIAQRFPVRVALDAPPAALMRLGATVVIVIDR